MKSYVSYKQVKIEDGYDVILIGSGIGSLVTASLLSRAGKKCLILERHYTPGGYTHVFKRKGYEWDVGIHYIGEVMREHSVLARLFRHVSDGSIEWADMGEVYDRIRFGDEIFPFYKGKEAFIDGLKEAFPDQVDHKSIEEYVKLVSLAAREARGFFTEKALPAMMAKVVGGRMRKGFLHYANRSTLEVLKTITQNPKLIAVLTAQYGDYGLPPSQSSFAMHAMVVKHYLGGGAYPVGGSARIFDGIAPTITQAGGLIVCNASVKKICIKKNKAYAVEMADGQILQAPVIISSAGVATTAHTLLELQHAKRAGFLECLQKIEHSAAHLCLYLGFKEKYQDLQLQAANWWYYPPEFDHDAIMSRFLKDPQAELPVIYTSFPSAKDPSWSERFPNSSTVEVITVAPYELFSQWEGSRWHKRGADYEAYKEEWAQRMLSKLYELEPQLKGKVDHCELSTPLSTQHFCNYQKGEIYGLSHDPARFKVRSLRPQTKIKGLYLTGQDVATAGIGGAMMGGVLCASALLKKNLMMEIMHS
jgi:all-trans-retinol 13,14-reductase